MARTRTTLVVLAGVLVAGVTAFIVPRLTKDEASPTAAVATITSAPVPAALTPSDWCGDGFRALPSDVCYIDGRSADAGTERRTLVIWLHGVIGKNTHWSHDHVKMLSRMAKTTGIEMLFPKGTLGEQTYGWPQTTDALAQNEEALIDQWMTAKTALEQREGKFAETFIFGFSSGAYFASSLAMRGRVDGVDGYAVFAGGQAMPAPTTPVTHVAPVFVGVCANDPTGTAAHSRSLANSLAGAGIPFALSEEPVGHDLSPTHFTKALAFLRKR